MHVHMHVKVLVSVCLCFQTERIKISVQRHCVMHFITYPKQIFQQKDLSKNVNVHGHAHLQHEHDENCLHGDHESGCVRHLQDMVY